MKFVVSNRQEARLGKKAKIHIASDGLHPLCLSKSKMRFVPWQQDFAGPPTCRRCLRISTADKQ